MHHHTVSTEPYHSIGAAISAVLSASSPHSDLKTPLLLAEYGLMAELSVPPQLSALGGVDAQTKSR